MKQNEKIKILKLLLKGFIVGATPRIILDVSLFFSLGVFFSYVPNILAHALFFGFLGLAVSLLYYFSSLKYPLISKRIIIMIIIIYYLIFLGYIFAGFYLQDKII